MPQARTGSGRGLESRDIALAYTYAVAAFAVGVSALALLDHHRIANADDWRIYDDMFSNPLGEWIFTSQNGHRIPLTLALTWIDYRWLEGQMHLLVGVSLAFALGTSLLLWLACRREDGLPRALPLAGFTFAIFSLYWSHAGFAFLWGMMQGNLQLALFLAAALYALLRAAPGDRDAACDLRWLTAACAMAGAATFSHGAGFASFLAVLAVALAARIPLRAIAAIGGCALGVAALYLWGLWGDRGALLQADAGALLKLPVFVFAMVGGAAGHTARGLGMPFAHVLPVSIALGAIGLLVAGALLFGLRTKRPSPGGLVGIGLMAFAVGTAGLIALFRIHAPDGAEQAMKARFLHFSAFFWSGLVLFAACERGRSLARRGATTAVAAVVALSALMLPLLFELREVQARRDQTLEGVAFELMGGVQRDESAEKVSLESPDIVYRVADRFRADRRNFFAGDLPPLIGRSLRERFEIRERAAARKPEPGCPGRASWYRLVAARGGDALQAGGWAWSRGVDRPASLVLLVDPAERILALTAPFASGEPGLEEAPRQWGATIPRYQQGAHYRVYMAWREEGWACFAGLVPPRPRDRPAGRAEEEGA